jgi:hypothetical protein
MIPIPPNQWVKLRQNIKPWGSPSILVRIVAPVVVKPDIVSKNASVKLGISPESKNGRQPNREKKTHPNVTIANPSLALTSRINLVNLKARNPRLNVMSAE